MPSSKALSWNHRKSYPMVWLKIWAWVTYSSKSGKKHTPPPPPAQEIFSWSQETFDIFWLGVLCVIFGAILSCFVGHHLDFRSSACELSLPIFTGTVKKKVSTWQFPMTPVSVQKVTAALRAGLHGPCGQSSATAFHSLSRVECFVRNNDERSRSHGHHCKKD